ncbi:MAG: hypothetical protein PF569_03180 [Candidatus Woesearchaeota archaeon]|jgi:hypothetical protein|nr:hypothetical protein [Candidatus Woesearchaeota archaeon]
MYAILRTNDFDEDYKIVEVLRNPISENISLAEVQIIDKVFWTGGILCKITAETLEILERQSPKEQWEWLKSIKYPNLYL